MIEVWGTGKGRSEGKSDVWGKEPEEVGWGDLKRRSWCL